MALSQLQRRKELRGFVKTILDDDAHDADSQLAHELTSETSSNDGASDDGNPELLIATSHEGADESAACCEDCAPAPTKERTEARSAFIPHESKSSLPNGFEAADLPRSYPASCKNTTRC